MTLPDVLAALDDLTLPALAAVQAKVSARLVAIATEAVAPSAEDRLLTAEEAAGYLQRRPSWLYRRQGLPFRVRVGGRDMYSLNGIKEWASKVKGGR